MRDASWWFVLDQLSVCGLSGLEFAVLHFYERESTADLECLLCNESVNAKTNARIEHFVSFKHRVTYIVSEL